MTGVTIMASSVRFISISDNNSERTELFDTLTATGQTDPVRLQGRVKVQLSGSATSLTAIVEHATRDPGSAEANWAPVEDDPFTGDLSAGMSPRPYDDPAIGWWRVRVTAISGGNCKISIIGEKA